MSCVYFPQSDPETLLKCLTMCAELFKQMNIKRGICPTMNALIESLVLILIHKSTHINNHFLLFCSIWKTWVCMVLLSQATLVTGLCTQISVVLNWSCSYGNITSKCFLIPRYFQVCLTLTLLCATWLSSVWELLLSIVKTSLTNTLCCSCRYLNICVKDDQIIWLRLKRWVLEMRLFCVFVF